LRNVDWKISQQKKQRGGGGNCTNRGRRKKENARNVTNKAPFKKYVSIGATWGRENIASPAKIRTAQKNTESQGPNPTKEKNKVHYGVINVTGKRNATSKTSTQRPGWVEKHHHQPRPWSLRKDFYKRPLKGPKKYSIKNVGKVTRAG